MDAIQGGPSSNSRNMSGFMQMQLIELSRPTFLVLLNSTMLCYQSLNVAALQCTAAVLLLAQTLMSLRCCSCRTRAQLELGMSKHYDPMQREK